MSSRIIIIDLCENCPHKDGILCSKTGNVCIDEFIPDDCPLPEAIGYIMADGTLVSWEGTGKCTLPAEPSLYGDALEIDGNSEKFCVEIASGTWMFGSDGIYFKPTGGDVAPVLKFKKEVKE